MSDDTDDTAQDDAPKNLFGERVEPPPKPALPKYVIEHEQRLQRLVEEQRVADLAPEPGITGRLSSWLVDVGWKGFSSWAAAQVRLAIGAAVSAALTVLGINHWMKSEEPKPLQQSAQVQGRPWVAVVEVEAPAARPEKPKPKGP